MADPTNDQILSDFVSFRLWRRVPQACVVTAPSPFFFLSTVPERESASHARFFQPAHFLSRLPGYLTRCSRTLSSTRRCSLTERFSRAERYVIIVVQGQNPARRHLFFATDAFHMYMEQMWLRYVSPALIVSKSLTVTHTVLQFTFHLQMRQPRHLLHLFLSLQPLEPHHLRGM